MVTACLSALIKPIAAHSQVLRKELPILTAVTGLWVWQLLDNLDNELFR